MKAVRALVGMCRGTSPIKRLATVVAILATTVLAIPATEALAAGTVTVTTYGPQNTPLNGVTVGIFNSSNASVGTCLTTGAGTCQVSLGNGDYTAKVVTAAPGYNAISNIWLGTNSGGSGSTPAYAKSFKINNNNVAVWLMSRANNVPFPTRCGLKVALLIDTSGSTNGSEGLYKAAALNFVTSLTGTPSSIGVWSFAVTGVNQVGLTSLSTPAGIATVNTAINSVPAPSGGTNWDVGLNQLRGKGADLVVVITDGNPTLSSGIAPIVSADQSNVDVPDVEGGVWAANGVKIGLPTANPPVPGSSIVALAIGSGFTDPTNVKLISGPTAGTDYFTSSSVGGLDTLLKDLALKSCGGTITAQKQVAPIGSSTYTNAAGWTFTPAIAANNGAVTPASGPTDANGQVNYAFSGGTWPKTVTVTEAQQPGYLLVPQGGANAVCTLNNGSAVTTSNIANGVQLDLAQQAVVNCLFKNKAITNDLSILKTAPATAVPGGPAISYPITVTNSATSDPAATQVVVDTLPAGLTWAGYPTAAVQQNGWACAPPVGQALTCTRNVALAASATTTFTVTANVPVGYQGASPFTNCATVTDNLPNDANDTSCADTTVSRSVDIVITKTDGGASVNPGGAPITYTLTVDNLGPSDVKTGDVTTITDTLPTGMAWVTGSVTGCAAPAIAGQTMTCTIPSTLLKVSDPVITITGKVTVPVSESAVAPKTYTNKAYASTPDDLPCAGAACVPPCTGTTPAKAANNIACEDTPSNKLGTLTASKKVTGVTGDATTGTSWSFGFTLSGGTFTGTPGQPISGKGNTTVAGASWTNLQPGATYTLTEGLVAGFTPTLTCDGAAAGTGDTNPAANIVTFTAVVGQSVACTATNAAAPATIEVVKTTVGGTGTFDYTLAPASVTGLTTNVTTAGTSVSTGAKSGLIAGTSYTVTENAPGSAWSVGAFACSETLIGSQTSTKVTQPFTAQPGAAYKCAITNTKLGTITIVKDASPSSPVDFRFTGSLGAFALDDDGNATLSDTKKVSDLAAGNYSVVETDAAGWTLTSITCVETTKNTTVDVSVNVRTAFIVLDAGEDVTCTFLNTAKVPTLTIDKTTVGDDGSFTFDVKNLTPSGGVVVTTTAKAGTTGKLNLTPGSSYGVTERSDIGWTAGPLTCNVVLAGATATTNVADPTNFTAQAGDAFVCSITNTRKGQINIIKNTTGGDGGPFLFTGNWPGVSGFAISTGGGTGSKQYTNVVPGSYTVTETDATADYDLKSLQCVDTGDGGSTPSVATRQVAGTIDLDPGETVTCVYSNSKKGSITIIKDAQPNQPDDFAFTAPAPLTNFSLDDDGDEANTLLRMRTFPNLTATEVQSATYTVTEKDTPGWTLTSLTCSNTASTVSTATGLATITVGPGEAVVCTYVNTAKTGSVTVGKTTSGVAADLAWSFGFSISPLPASPAGQVNPKPITGTGNVAGTSTAAWTGLVAGQTYTVTEATSAGYTQSLTCAGITDTDGVVDRSVTFVATAGLTLTCAATNAAKTAQVTITKTVTGVASGFAWSFAFGISPALGGQATPKTISGTGNATGSTTATWTSLVPGSTYTISEPAIAGWAQVLTCAGITDADGKADTSVTFTATPNLDLACTATNTAAPATVEVVKTTTGGYGTFDFTVTPAVVTGLTATTAAELNPASTGVKSGLLAGTSYTVAETDPGSSWIPGALTCTKTPAVGTPSAVTATFVAEAGAAYRCVVTNTKRGTIVVAKATVGSTGTFVFTGSVTGSITTTSAAGTPSGTSLSLDVVPGSSYSLAETAQAGWDLTSATCSDGSPIGKIDVAAGEVVTCTFVNTKRSTIVVVKNVEGDNGTFDFSGDWNDPAAFAITTSGGAGNGTGVSQFDDVAPGTYTVQELNLPADYAGRLLCSDSIAGATASTVAGLTGTIGLDPGETVTCTFTNSQLGSIVIDKVTVPAADTTTEFGYTLTGSSDFTLVNGGPAHSSGLLPAGTYTVSEKDHAGWVLQGLTCASADGSVVTIAAATAQVQLVAGDTVSCTYTNRQLLADVAIVKTVDNASPAAGQTFVWTLSITNNGPDDAHSVVISDQVPASVKLVSVASTDFSCVAIESSVTCVRDLLKAGEGGFVTVVATAPDNSAGQTIENTGRVTSSTPDPDLTNNTSVSPVRVADVVVVAPPPPLEPPAVDAPLPETGSNVQLIWTLGGELLLAGVALILVRRRVRRRA